MFLFNLREPRPEMGREMNLNKIHTLIRLRPEDRSKMTSLDPFFRAGSGPGPAVDGDVWRIFRNYNQISVLFVMWN